MLNVAAPIWNEVAKEGLRTPLFQRLMPMDQDAMTKAHDQEVERLEQEGTAPTVALAYMKVAPLLAERQAIQSYVAKNQRWRHALPSVTSIEQAVAMMSKSRQLTSAQQTQLSNLLQALNNSPKSEASSSPPNQQPSSMAT